MAIVVRRTFFGNVGQGGPLVDLVKEMESFFNEGGISMKTRVLSDFYSGRTDRVVHEAEVDSWADYQRIEQVINADPEAFKAWFAKLTPLIDGAEVEAWQVH